MAEFFQKIYAEFQSQKQMIFFGYGIALLCFMVDIISKFTVSEWLRSVPEKSVTIIPNLLNMTEVWNHGISFGMFQAGSMMDLWALRIVTVCILMFLGYVHIMAKHKIESFGLSFVLGGACGNIFDRFYHGAVYDFIDVIIMGQHFWTFNIADAAITVGAILMIYDQIFAKKTTES